MFNVRKAISTFMYTSLFYSGWCLDDDILYIGNFNDTTSKLYKIDYAEKRSSIPMARSKRSSKLWQNPRSEIRNLSGACTRVT